MFGDGELSQQLQIEIRGLPIDLQSRITLSPPTENVDSILSQTDILCAPSSWEGFPNVVAESLAAGLPVIGFRDCDGVSDLIRPGVNGWLAGDSEDGIGELTVVLRESYLSYQTIIQNQEILSLSVAQFTEKSTREMWNKVFDHYK
jgi:glycosyltransferase involved in cell wall biosynthesis